MKKFSNLFYLFNKGLNSYSKKLRNTYDHLEPAKLVTSLYVNNHPQQRDKLIDYRNLFIKAINSNEFTHDQLKEIVSVLFSKKINLSNTKILKALKKQKKQYEDEISKKEKTLDKQQELYEKNKENTYVPDTNNINKLKNDISEISNWIEFLETPEQKKTVRRGIK